MATSVDVYLGRKRKSSVDAMAPPILARYDVAQDTDEYKNYWSATDNLDADSANSKAVRNKVAARSRYEIGSNAYVDGMVQAHANYVVGVGPSLRMQTLSTRFNAMVENRWKSWSKAVMLRRKLWTMAHAKMSDGEAFAVLSSNQKINHEVKLDIKLIEAEQCTTPYLQHGVTGYIDGIRFDDFGNPLWYDILPYHPGGQWYVAQPDPDPVPAAFILHWFSLRRPGQHRGMAELKSSLNVGASSRRWREATIGAAETAADVSVLLKTQQPPDDGMDIAAPFSSIEFQKRMIMAMPAGYDLNQMKAENPNAEYQAFLRAQISEQGRPKNMPHNLAAGDSSDHNFASGKLDLIPYYMQVDVERADGNDLALDPLFEMWFREAAVRFGWLQIDGQTPAHSWDWPSHPVADEKAKASANENRLRTAQATLSSIYAEDGKDFADEIEVMAEDYGLSVDEMRKLLRETIFNNQGAISSMVQVESVAQPENKQQTVQA